MVDRNYRFSNVLPTAIARVWQYAEEFWERNTFNNIGNMVHDTNIKIKVNDKQNFLHVHDFGLYISNK